MLMPNFSYPYCRTAFEAQQQAATPAVIAQKTDNKIWESHCQNVVVLANARWNILMEMAEQCENRGHYDTAELLWFRALDTATEFSLKDPRVLYTISRVANHLYKAGEIDRAKTFFIAHAEVCSTLFGEKHVKTADSISRLGMVYFSQKSYLAAELCFSHALGIYHADTGETSERVMRTRENMAQLLKAQGDRKGAARQLNLAMTSSFRLFGPNSYHTQNLAHQLAAVAPGA